MTEVQPRVIPLKLRGKSPIARQTANSYAWLIRNGIMTRVQSLPAFTGFTKFSKTPALPVQPDHLPHCGVYLLTETMGADGDSNHGEPRFIHTIKIGFSVMVQNNDPDRAEERLDFCFNGIMDGLLTDPTLYHNNIWKIESYTGGMRSHHFGMIGSANEVPMAELRFELNFNYRTYWPPFVVDDLERIHTEIVQLPDVNDPAVRHILTEFDMEQ